MEFSTSRTGILSTIAGIAAGTDLQITHLVTYPRNVDPRREAVAQDVAALDAATRGAAAHTTPQSVRHISPWEPSRPIYPERLFGLWLWPAARSLNATTDVFHVWHWPRAFVFLRWLRKPLLFTANAGLSPVLASRAAGLMHTREHVHIVVSSQRDLKMLQAAGLDANLNPTLETASNNAVSFIRPGIDLTRFPLLAAQTLTPGQPFKLLCASAPWQPADFARKGIDALLTAASAIPQLHLTFLWRDLLLAEMTQRVAQAGLGARVRVVNALADVSAELAQAHASVLLASDASIVKAYPNSLMEAICSGRPVLTSRAIPISDDVEALGCGVVANKVQADAVRMSVTQLIENYAAYETAARAVPRDRFDRTRWLSEYLQHYANIGRKSISRTQG